MQKIISLIIGLTLLSSCSLEVDKTPSSEIVERIESAKEISKTVELKLTQSQISAKTFKIKVQLENPEMKEINSVRTWLAFNPESLKIISIETENSDFDLAAPGENNIEIATGLIKIGRSKTTGNVNKTQINLGEITVEKIQTGSVVIDFYDYQEDQSGHTNANILIDGKVYNLAKKPDSPALVIK